MEKLGPLFIGLGIVFLLVGFIFLSGVNFPLPGNLPGDIRIEKEGFSFYFPITSSILFSVFLSLLFWLFSR
ncbi:MAG: DUF2905 domain-containing protein [Leptospiraceae bacterium]|nr:DUF2905 domain-containing protein [Leptospiraceae bacterium]MCP5510496.1 DUF2905 domain-containing protein [Leptospiraceae bacterium]